MDQVALQQSGLDFHLSGDGRKVLAAYAPDGSGADEITSDTLRELLDDAGFGKYRILEAALRQAAAKCNSQQAFEIEVGEAVDAKFTIQVDSDKMAARFSLTRAMGGNPVAFQDVLQEIEHQKITAQIDVAAIEAALQSGEADRVLIACGKPPLAGSDARFESLIPSAKDRHPHLDEKGIADFHDLGEITVVHAGDPLMRRIAPTAGEPGEDVFGHEVAARPGRDAAFPSTLHGAEVSGDDPDLLVAAITGQPVLLKNGVSVEETFSVPEVDLASGNIEFDGSVHVTEDVQSGMMVKASGDIHVDGTVENAILDAGGDIVVKGGILGGTELQAGEQFHPEIRCKGSLHARFVQKMNVSAGQGIFIEEVAMQCHLTAGHQIVVGKESGGRGKLIGGTSRASLFVKAGSIGNEAGLKTTIIAGPDPALIERLKVASNIREAWENRLFNLVMQIEAARSKPGASADALEAFEKTRAAVVAELDVLLAKEAELKRELDLASEAQVVAERTIYGGVEVVIGNKRINTSDEGGGGVFRLEDGELIFATE